MSASEVEEDDQEEVTQDLEKYYKVSSEVTGFTRGETLNGLSAVLSRFDFVYPAYKGLNKTEENLKVTLDKDGDAQVIRKNELNKKEDALLIEHQNSTTLDLVGEQVWAAALYLADFILQNPSIFSDRHIVELGAGVGLTSVVAGMFANKVTVTDIDQGEILDLIKRNINRNDHLLLANTEVKELDFLDQSTVDALQDSLEDVTILIAADIIYNNPLTDGFLNTLLQLMSKPPNKTLYLAMEKRYVFTMEDMDAVAPCYEYLVERLEWLRYQNLSQIEWTVEFLDTPCEQYFTYERNKNLVMWKIQAKLKNA